MSCNHTGTKEDTENKELDDASTCSGLGGGDVISGFCKSLLSFPSPTFFPQVTQLNATQSG